MRLMDEIEQLRAELNGMSLRDPALLRKSENLDLLLNQYYAKHSAP